LGKLNLEAQERIYKLPTKEEVWVNSLASRSKWLNSHIYCKGTLTAKLGNNILFLLNIKTVYQSFYNQTFIFPKNYICPMWKQLWGAQSLHQACTSSKSCLKRALLTQALMRHSHNLIVFGVF